MPAEPAGEQRWRHAIGAGCQRKQRGEEEQRGKDEVEARHRISLRASASALTACPVNQLPHESQPPGTSTSRAWRVASATTGWLSLIHI